MDLHLIKNPAAEDADEFSNRHIKTDRVKPGRLFYSHRGEWDLSAMAGSEARSEKGWGGRVEQ